MFRHVLVFVRQILQQDIVMVVEEVMKKKKIWKLEDTTDDWKKENLKNIRKRLIGWQLESFEESYTYKIENGISLFKKNLKNE